MGQKDLIFGSKDLLDFQLCCTIIIPKYISVHVPYNSMIVNTARQTSVRADKTILLYIIVGVNQLSCEPETLNINKVVVHTLSRL